MSSCILNNLEFTVKRVLDYGDAVVATSPSGTTKGLLGAECELSVDGRGGSCGCGEDFKLRGGHCCSQAWHEYRQRDRINFDFGTCKMSFYLTRQCATGFSIH